MILFTSGHHRAPEGRDADAPQPRAHGLGHGLRPSGDDAAQQHRRRRPPDAPPPASICATPFFHISGTAPLFMTGSRFGSHARVPAAGSLGPRVHLRLTADHRVSAWSGVPTHFWRMLEHPDFDSFDLSCLTMVSSGGTPFPPELIRLIRERIHDVDVSNGYGATETTGVGTVLSGALQFAAGPESVGPAVPTMQLQVRDEGTVLGEGEIGEVSGPWPDAHFRRISALAQHRASSLAPPWSCMVRTAGPTRFGTQHDSAHHSARCPRPWSRSRRSPLLTWTVVESARGSPDDSASGVPPSRR